MPDLNSLPPSQTAAASIGVAASQAQMEPSQASTSPSSTSTSALAQAATINAGMQQQLASTDAGPRAPGSSSPQLLHRPARSTGALARPPVPTNLALADPTLPGPGELQTSGSGTERRGSVQGGRPSSRRGSQHSAYRRSPSATNSPRSPGIGLMGDPHHQRAPSLGELHQELEQEQEAQVNRLLQMIRQQQAQLSHYQAQHAHDSDAPPAAAPLPGLPRTRSPHARAPLSRQSSYRSSERGSPGLGAGIGGAPPPLPPGALAALDEPAARDEVAFYQAETQNLTRENQMLRVRIRDLERQLADPQRSQPAETPVASSGLAVVESVGASDERKDAEPVAEGGQVSVE